MCFWLFECNGNIIPSHKTNGNDKQKDNWRELCFLRKYFIFMFNFLDKYLYG